MFYSEGVNSMKLTELTELIELMMINTHQEWEFLFWGIQSVKQWTLKCILLTFKDLHGPSRQLYWLSPNSKRPHVGQLRYQLLNHFQKVFIINMTFVFVLFWRQRKAYCFRFTGVVYLYHFTVQAPCSYVKKGAIQLSVMITFTLVQHDNTKSLQEIQ